MVGGLARLDRARHLDSAAEEQQFLGQRCFSGIRMTYYAEGSSPLYFFF